MTQVAAEKTAEELAAEEAARLEEEQKAEAEALRDFTEGFTDQKVEPTEEEKKAAEEAARLQEEANAAELAAKAAEPELATPTKQEFQDLVTKAGTIGEIRALAEKVRDTVSGRMGSLEQTIKKLQESTPFGQAIVVTPEDFAEIGKDMPDHAKMLADGLTRVLSKFKGTGQTVQAETPEQFEERVNQVADKRIAEREAARLKAIQDEARADLVSVHPDWETVIGPKDSNTDFRKYIKEKGLLYEKKILSTNDAEVLSEAITQFKEVQEAKKKPTPKTNARAEQLREAIRPKGSAGVPNTKRELTPEEAFAEGFNS